MTPADYQEAFDLLPEAVLVHEDGRLLYANGAARALVGAADNDAVAQSMAGLFAAGADTAARQQRIERLDGSTLEVEISTGSIATQSGEPVLMIVRDVTERERARRDAEQRRRAESIAHVAHSIAHEFNNVLMGAGTFATVLSRKLGNEDVGVQGMRTALERGRQVTSDILRYARGVEIVRQEVAVEEWLRDVVAAATPLVAPCTIVLTVDGAPPSARIDRVQFTEALTALLVRAHDVMPAGGTIELTARAAGEALVITIRDHGQPLPAEALDRIFEPSFSTKKGPGLALAIAQQIVLRHGGVIDVFSDEAGTAFAVVVFS